MTHLELSEVMLQVVASPTIVIQTNLEVSFTFLENIYGTEISHADCHLPLSYFYSTGPFGLYHKDITIVNDTIGLSVQVVASPMIVIQMTLEVLCILLENIYSTGITHVDCHLLLSYFYSTGPCGLYYKDITIVNDTIGLSVQVVASPTIIIQTTLEASCMLSENIYGTGITHADRHLWLSYFYSTSPCGQCYKDITIVNDTIGLSVQVVASPMIVIQMTLEV
jgi:hypothetical protein